MSRVISTVLFLLVSQVSFADIYTAKLECHSSANIRLHMIRDSYQNSRVYMTSQWTQPETGDMTDWRRKDVFAFGVSGTSFDQGILEIGLEDHSDYYNPSGFDLKLKNFHGTKTCQVLTGTIQRSGNIQAATYVGEEKVTCAVRIRSEDEDRLENRYSDSRESECSLPAESKAIRVNEANTPLSEIPIGSKLITSGVRSDYMDTVYDTAGNEDWAKAYYRDASTLDGSFDLKALGVKDHRSQYVNDSDQFLKQIGCRVTLPKAVTQDKVSLPRISTIKDIDDNGNLTLDNGAVLTCQNYEVDTQYLGGVEYDTRPAKLLETGPFTVTVLRRVLAKNKIQLELKPVPANLPVKKSEDDGQ